MPSTPQDTDELAAARRVLGLPPRGHALLGEELAAALGHLDMPRTSLARLVGASGGNSVQRWLTPGASHVPLPVQRWIVREVLNRADNPPPQPEEWRWKRRSTGRAAGRAEARRGAEAGG
jgi:hypothetical protein